MSSQSNSLQQLADRDGITIYSAARKHDPDGWMVALTKPRPEHYDPQLPTQTTLPMAYFRAARPQVGDVLEYFLSLAAYTDAMYDAPRRVPQVPGMVLARAEEDMKFLLGKKYDEYMQTAGHRSGLSGRQSSGDAPGGGCMMAGILLLLFVIHLMLSVF